jgi:hypothetical protein
LGPLKVEVVCHDANRHKLRDEGIDVLEPRRYAEQEPVARLPEPLPQNPEPLRRFRYAPKVERCNRSEFWKQRVQNRVEDINPVTIGTNQNLVCLKLVATRTG